MANNLKTGGIKLYVPILGLVGKGLWAEPAQHCVDTAEVRCNMLNFLTSSKWNKQPMIFCSASVSKILTFHYFNLEGSRGIGCPK